MPIKITREEYEKKFGVKPDTGIKSTILTSDKEVQETDLPGGYFSRLGSAYKKATLDIVSGIKKGAEQAAQGQVQGGIKGALNVAGGLARGGLRTVGGVAGAAFAPITEAPGIKQGLETIGAGVAKIPGVDKIIGEATELSEKHPELAKDLQNIIDIAVLGGGKVAQKPVGIALKKGGVALEESGVESLNIAKGRFAQELIKPTETKAVKLAQVPRTTETKGLFRENVVIPTAAERSSAEAVAQIPGISAKNNFQKNFNIVRDFNREQAKQLESDVAKSNFIIPKKEVMSRLDDAARELGNSPLVVGDAAKTAERLVEGARRMVGENEGTGAGLLKARKDYDKWVLSQKPNVFDAKAENALTIANDAVRRTLNNLLDEKAPTLGIKESLKKQSSLFNAMENIGPKAAEEANTAFGRIMQRVGKTLGTKNKIVQGIAAAVGIGGLGAAATFATPAVLIGGTGYLIYRGGRLVLSPQVRILLGKLLKTSGHLLDPFDRKLIGRVIEITDSK